MSKIDLIIDALSVAQNSVWSALNEQALAAARELQAEEQEPVNTMPTKIFGPNLEQILNAAGFYKREWVGLTIDESSELYNKNYDLYATDMPIGDFLMIRREIEAKLKEKNT